MLTVRLGGRDLLDRNQGQMGEFQRCFKKGGPYLLVGLDQVEGHREKNSHVWIV